MQYRCRTESPEHADLFFVPAYTLHFGARKVCVDAWPTNRKNCSRDALLNRLRAMRNGLGVPYLEARGGQVGEVGPRQLFVVICDLRLSASGADARLKLWVQKA